MSRALVTLIHLPPPLEPNILERLCRGAVEVCCKPVVAAPGGEIAARDPCGSAMAGRAELAEAGLGGGERRLGLVEPVLLEQRAAEHELRAADLVEVVLAAVEQPERMPRLLLGLRRRRRCAGGSARARRRPAPASASRPVSRAMPNASFSSTIASSVLPSRKLKPPRLFVSWPTCTRSDELLVRGARLLGVVAREDPVPLAVGDHRRLEVRVADRARVGRILGELERALDVLARGLVVALAAPAPRAPREDVRAQRVGRQPGALGERERLVQQAERRLDAVELVAADAEREEHLGALEVGEVARPRRCPRASFSRSSAVRSAPRRICVRPAPTSARTSSSGIPVARDAGTSVSYSAAASSLRCASIIVSARASAASRRPRSSVATPFARKPASQPRRDASHSTVSPRRARLAALDLGDVLLREPVAGELALRQASGDAQLSKPLAEAEYGGRCSAAAADCGLSGHAL